MSEWDPKANEIFLEAAECATSESRHAYLEHACGADLKLRQQVESLLEADLRAPSILDRTAPLLSLEPQVTNLVGIQIGPYKLREQLGEGGMGIVYVAEQAKPVRRKVALKIIKPGMATADVVARFEAERQALAMMDHPNIARVIDGGTTESEQPYFVMELVRGVPITEYCDQHRLGNRGRLEIFQQVCRAVQHAHLKAIIHRDIKPSNVLVAEIDGRAVPKVIDFGVAKAVSQKLTDKTVYTQFSQMVGTPMYMSPEQTGMGVVDIDTRSDVYSLGVLLYELLTGDTPFDRESMKQAGFVEMRRIICEVEPPRPSTRMTTLKAEVQSTIAARRGCQPSTLASSLKGEIDWIVMKSLEKDRARRYESASALAEDIQRYLDNEPILACPPSTTYRFRKFARRHRAPLLAATAFVTILVAATIVSSSLAAWAIEEQSDAAGHSIVAERERGVALDARALAQRQEQLAKQQRDAADYDAYVANIQLAYSRWTRGSALFKSLDTVVPQSGRPDFRGWEWYFLHSQVHNELFSFPLQRDVITWSPSGNKLATVDQTGLVNIWDIRSGLYEKSLAGCPGNIRSLAWSPNGEILAAGSDHKVVVIWEIESGIALRTLRDATPITNVDWNPDSIRLASAGEDGAVSIWDARTGERLSSLILNAGPVYSLEWHPDGNLLLASGGRSGSNDVKIWNSATDAEVTRLKYGYNHSASFSPNGKRLVCGYVPVTVVDLETREVVSSFPESGAMKSSWSADGRSMASAITNDVIRIWDVETGVVTGSIQRSNAGRPVVWSPVGSLLASKSNGVVKVWDAVALGNNPRTLSTQGNGALSVAFSPDGRRLLTGASSGLHKLWDVESGEELFSVQSGLSWNRSVTFSPDGKKFAAIGPANGKVVVRDAATGKSLLELPESTDVVRSLAWSPEGNVLAVGYRTLQFKAFYGRVELFDTHSGLSVAASGSADGECTTLAWNHDGSRLAASGDSIRIFDPGLHDKATVAVRSRCLQWSPDGKQLATSGVDGTTTIYDTAAWTPIHDVDGHDAFVSSIDWHPHMPRIATKSQDGTTRIFDSLTGRELCLLAAPGKSSGNVAWSPDGMRLAAPGGAIFRVWDGSSADGYLKRHGDLREAAWDLVKQEKFQLAFDALEQLRQLHPQEGELVRQSHNVRWLWSVKLAVDGQVAESVAIFDQLRAESAVVPDYRLQVPARIFAAGKHETAIAMAEKFAVEFPDAREYRDELGFLYEARAMQLFQAGQFADGTLLLRKLAEKFPDRPDFRGQLAFEMARTHQLAESVAIFEQLAEAFDDRADYRPALATRLTKAGEHEMAVTIYEQLVADHPDSHQYQILLRIESIHGLIRNGQLDEAKAMLLQLAEQNPNHEPQSDADSERGAATIPGTEIGQATRELSDALGRAYKDQASAAARHGEFDKALTNYESAIELVSDTAELYNNFAWLLATTPAAENRDASRALALALKAVELGPEVVTCWNTLGVAQFRAEDLTAAIASLNKSLALDTGGTGFPYNSFFLAMAHWQLGDQEEAHSWFDRSQQWMSENRSTDEELLRFQVEAEELLGAKKKLDLTKVEEDKPD